MRECALSWVKLRHSSVQTVGSGDVELRPLRLLTILRALSSQTLVVEDGNDEEEEETCFLHFSSVQDESGWMKGSEVCQIHTHAQTRRMAISGTRKLSSVK